MYPPGFAVYITLDFSMPLLTKRDITIAVFKAAASQVPGYGPFVAEAVGAVDQRASFDALESRVARLESILLAEKNPLLIARRRVRNNLRSAHITHDRQNFSRAYLAAKSDPNTLEAFLLSLNLNPPAEYFNARPAVRVCMLEEILSNKQPLIATTNSVSFSTQFLAGSDMQPFTVAGREALISASLQELERADEEEDCFVLLRAGTDDSGMVDFTYVPEVWRLLGFQFCLGLQHMEGIACFIRAIELGVYEPENVMINIALAFFNSGNRTYAIQRLKQLVDAHKYDLNRRIALADALDGIGNTTEAEFHYQAFIDEYESRLKEIHGYTYGASSQINYQRARIALGKEI
jgi:tetratricopeptide (TPR) repeat protein